jgi:MtfA peptidase
MPPDTTHIPRVTGPPPQAVGSLIDSFELKQQLIRESYQQHLDSLGNRYLHEQAAENNDNPFGAVMFFILLFIMAGSAFFYVVKPDLDAKKRKKQKYKLDPDNKPTTEMQYHLWLNKYNHYYASLPPDLRTRFIERTSQFMLKKEFKFHSMVEEEYIPVLISGAAAQMTFGLKNYMMDYFPVVHVIRKEYVLNVDKETYYGHVSRSGIYISWSSFLEGYNDYTDSVNVGLHEMAHAVSYDLFLGEQDEHDVEFRERLSGFSREGTRVFRAMKNGEHHFLDSYASTNFDEFWAVCVETFFENPVIFRENEPVLYGAMCHLLNQDPLTDKKILNEEIAGL